MTYYFCSYAWERKASLLSKRTSGYGRTIIRCPDGHGFDPSEAENILAKGIEANFVVIMFFREVEYAEWMKIETNSRLELVKT